MYKRRTRDVPMCDHYKCDRQFCIECDRETCFIEWFCTGCGCHSPKGDPCDDTLDDEGWSRTVNKT